MSAKPRGGNSLSPLAELDGIISRLESRIQKSSEAYIESILPPENDAGKQQGSFFASTIRRLASGTPPPSARPSPTSTPDHTVTEEEEDWPSQAIDASSPSDASRDPRVRNNNEDRSKHANAIFIDIPEEEVFVEDLRRVAELCVIGENYVTAQEKKAQKEMEKSRKQWSSDRDMLSEGDDNNDESGAGEKEVQSPEFADVFDMFFERNTLQLLVELLNGDAYNTTAVNRARAKAMEARDQGLNRKVTPRSSKRPFFQSEEEFVLVPPFSIATQAIQSISILVQNVSRATSLYILFSNDHINHLINLQLELYASAEQRRRIGKGEKSSVFASAEVAELTTHFITMLKSLALRMNAETLQFFLQYPEEIDRMDSPIASPHLADGYDPTNLRVKFPLYDRALDFCAAHQDSFVRVTAMNICLNTIRLTTVVGQETEPAELDVEEEEGAFGSAILSSAEKARSSSTPDIALHRSKGLPFRERLAIAQHTCTPSRVEKLIAPIFTKLSERWTSLDEAIRDMDAHEVTAAEVELTGMIVSARTEKVAKVKEKVKREKLVGAFKAKAADLQDELLLLEDVFMVGLTVLNEQMIEMMMATFVYPLLLQPLVLFSQRYTSVVENRGPSALNPLHTTFSHPFVPGYTGNYNEAQARLAAVGGPAKTALFTTAAVFQLLTNPPLLRLMFTALLHPISPDSSTVPTVRSTLQVATVDVHGRGTIRVDNPAEGDVVPDSRSSYPFGTNEINRRSSASPRTTNDADEESEVCVFVLAPALAEVLEYRGQDYDVIARTRPNAYRHALFQCVGLLPEEFALVRSLAVCTVDAAMERLDPKLASDLLFGVDLKTFADDMPMDERNLDSSYAHQEHDRGLGGGVGYESRHSIVSSGPTSVGTNLVGQVIIPLVTAVLNTKRGLNKEWKLTYDSVASHALLLAAKGHVRGLIASAKAMDARRAHAAEFLSQLPALLHSPMSGGGLSYFLSGVPQSNAANYDEQVFGAIMNVIINGSSAGEQEAAIEALLQLHETSPDAESEEGYSVQISSQCDFNEMAYRFGSDYMADLDTSDSSKQHPVNRDLMELRHSVHAFFQVDALVALLKDMAATSGVALRDVELAGMALASNGSFIETMDWKYSKKVFARLSRGLTNVLLSPSSVGPTVKSGSTLRLAGYPAIPCVCEAPASLASLFSSEESGIVAQGVTWQSLYLVFRDGWMIFAQPIPGGESGEGRVIGACLLQHTYVDKDATPVDGGSPARRLLFSYSSFDITPPPLFLFDEMPKKDKGHPQGNPDCAFCLIVFVWMESSPLSRLLSIKVASSQIFNAKAQHGRTFQSYLSPVA